VLGYDAFSKMTLRNILLLAAGWFIPGLGHGLQRKYARAAIFFVCITAMAGLGLLMDGRIFEYQTENPLTILEFFSDLGYGLLYLLSRLTPIGLGKLSSLSFEYGTAYIAGAGLLNYLVALDAFDIARGKKK